MLNGGSRAMLAFGLLGWLVGCAAHKDGVVDDQSAPNPPSSSVASPAPSTNQGAASGAATGGIAGSPGPVSGAAANGTAGGQLGDGTPSADGCAANLPFKKAGCACQAGETAACWTGPAADRNVGKCHDGLQICSASGSSEFQVASWGPCMGDQLSCGTDGGVPPPPATDAGVPTPPEDCSCIPGAIIQCSEDCSVGIICSLTATKTCLPDRTWSVCREDMGVTLDLPGVQCRNMLHGCFGTLSSDGPTQGQGELYVGDCSKQFACGHAPPPDSQN